MNRRSSRIAFLAILALFVVPLIAAWLMYAGAVRFEPGETVNAGRLVVPPQPLEWTAVERDPAAVGPAELAGAWVALYPLPQPCEADCLERVRMLRQVHRASGKEAERIRIAVLTDGPPSADLAMRLREIHSQVHLLYRPEAGFSAALQKAGEAAAQPSVYLVDPLGNVMMIYETDDSMSKLREDLKKLLKWSKLGQGTDRGA